MKKYLVLFTCMLALFISFAAFSEETKSEAELLKEKYEERAFKCLNTLTKYLVDDLSVYGTTNEFVKKSDAWNAMFEYDGGWFAGNNGKTVKNLRTDGWEKVSDTEFCVNVYCDYEVLYLRDREPVNYPCSYHFCFTQTDARKDVWMVKDFHLLSNEWDVAHANKFTEENEGITVEPVIGKTFTGFMMIIDDPSRVYVGTIPRFRTSSGGMRMDELVKLHGALGGINGGGFDEGTGGSSRPSGIVYSMGEHKQTHMPNNFLTKVLMGFDENNKLHVGTYTNKEVDALNLRDALGFGPALIIEGKAQNTGDTRNEFSARTAIGQDADGRVLMLVVRGRQPDSLGANMVDLIKIMQDYGAVNAGNLDGGNSTAMYLNEGIVYSAFRLESSRTLPAGFLIKKLP